LTAAKLPVPPAFIVTIAAYRRCVADNNLQAAIIEAASAGGIDPASLEHAGTPSEGCSSTTRCLATWPRRSTQRCAALARETPAVAVRSLATAEDVSDRWPTGDVSDTGRAQVLGTHLIAV
jgi:phosphoenolpyruvate synthase/pyruvate phosphate dikinase